MGSYQTNKLARGVAQAIERLRSKLEALSSNPSTSKSDSNKTKKLLHSKGNNQDIKIQVFPSEWEKIFANSSSNQEPMCRMYKEPSTLSARELNLRKKRLSLMLHFHITEMSSPEVIIYLAIISNLPDISEIMYIAQFPKHI
jgi:hypothetical protein